jgi:SAM-dependent methyltransferase
MRWPFQQEFDSFEHCVQSLNWGFQIKDAEEAAKRLVTFAEDEFEFDVRAVENGLDLGCGYGRLTKVLADRGITMEGMDVNRDLFAHYRDYMGKDMLIYDGQNIPLPDRSVSLVCSTLVFKHLTSFQFRNLLYEVERVIKMGGILFFDILRSPLAWVDLDNVMHDHDNQMLTEFLEFLGFEVQSEPFSPREYDKLYQRVYYAVKTQLRSSL